MYGFGYVVDTQPTHVNENFRQRNCIKCAKLVDIHCNTCLNLNVALTDVTGEKKFLFNFHLLPSCYMCHQSVPVFHPLNKKDAVHF